MATPKSILGAYASNWRTALLIILVMSQLMVIIGWGLNIAGVKWMNLVFFLLGGMWVIFKGLGPTPVLTFMGLGSLINTNRVAGAKSGLNTLAKAIYGVLIAIWWTFGYLSVIPFEDAPMSFWYTYCFGLLIGAVMANSKIPGKIFERIVFWFAGLVIFFHLLIALQAPIERLTGWDINPFQSDAEVELADVMKTPGFEIRVVEGVAVIVYTEVGAIPVEPTVGSQMIFIAGVDFLVKIPDQGCLRFDSFADQAELEDRTEYFPELRLYKIKASPEVTSISALSKDSPTCTGG